MRPLALSMRFRKFPWPRLSRRSASLRPEASFSKATSSRGDPVVFIAHGDLQAIPH